MPAPPDPETCDACSFDGSLWSDTDAIRTLHNAGGLIRYALEGCEPDIVHRRPDTTTWSIVEYIDHLREVVFANHFVAATAAAGPGTDMGSAVRTSIEGADTGPIASTEVLSSEPLISMYPIAASIRTAIGQTNFNDMSPP